MSLENFFRRVYAQLSRQWAEEPDREKEQAILNRIKALLEEAEKNGVKVAVDDWIMDALEEKNK